MQESSGRIFRGFPLLQLHTLIAMGAILSDCKAVALASPMLGNRHGRSSEKSLLTKTVTFSGLRTLGDFRKRFSRFNPRFLVWIPTCAGMTVVFSFRETTLGVSHQLIHSLQALGHNRHDLDGKVRRLFYQESKALAIDRHQFAGCLGHCSCIVRPLF